MTINTIAQPALPVLVDDTGISSSDNITNLATPMIRGEADPDTVITLYDGDGMTIVGTGVTDASGIWRINTSTLGDGPHALSATVGDGAGDVSAPSPLLNIVVDTIAPDAPGAPRLAAGQDTGLSDSDGITRMYIPTITGTAEAGSSVEVFSSDGVTTIGHGTADTNGIYTIALDNALAEGANRLLVQATDVAGNVSLLSAPGAAIIVDDIAPDAPTGLALDPASDSGVPGDLSTSARSVMIDGHAEAGTTVTLREGFDPTVLGTAVADANGNWQIQSVALAIGDHSLNVTATDLAGNVSNTSDSLLLTIVPPVPPAAPTALLLAAGSDSGIRGDGISSVNVPVITGQGQAGAIVTLYDHGGVVLGTATADTNGAWSIVSAALADGAHTLTAIQTDPVGGGVSAASAVLQLHIDTVAPAALRLSSDSVAVNVGADAVVGLLSATDAGTGVLKYALATGAGDDDNTAFSIIDNVLYINDAAALGVGDQSLRVSVTDAAGNSYEQDLTVHVAAPQTPPPDQSDSSTTSTVDGVPVVSSSANLPGGGSGTSVIIPVILAGSIDSASGLADIPLYSGSGGVLLTAHVPVGIGLTAVGGAAEPAGQSADGLHAAILASSHDVAGQAQLAAGGEQFLGQLGADTPLLLSTVTLSNAAGASDPALTLTGAAGEHTALVINAGGMTASGHLVLQNVDFAAVIGALDVSGDTANQVLTGDGAGQHFSVFGSGSTVLAGAGDDTLAYADMTVTAPHLSTQAQQQAAVAAPAAIVLDGGNGDDTAVFANAEADYTITRYDGHTVVVNNVEPGQQILVSNVETLRFADASIALDGSAALDTLAGMYVSVFGRQSDIGGFEFWGQAQESGDATQGQVALGLIGSSEGAAHGYTFTGDAKHDVDMLYQALFNRAADAGGEAFWVQALHDGHSLAEVAQDFVTSPEIVGHQLAATSWNLHY